MILLVVNISFRVGIASIARITVGVAFVLIARVVGGFLGFLLGWLAGLEGLHLACYRVCC